MTELKCCSCSFQLSTYPCCLYLLGLQSTIAQGDLSVCDCILISQTKICLPLNYFFLVNILRSKNSSPSFKIFKAAFRIFASKNSCFIYKHDITTRVMSPRDIAGLDVGF